MEKDYKDLIGKISDIESHAKYGLRRYIPRARLLISELSTLLKEVRFSKQDFPADKPISNIKYHYPGSQTNKPFCLFNDQLDYILVNYFVESKTTKGNIDRFISIPLIALLTQKLCY